MINYKTIKKSTLIVFLFFAITCFSQNKFTVEGDIQFNAGNYFQAIEYYKKGEIKERIITEKARVNYQLAECYRYCNEPAQSQTYYQRAIKLRYHEINPSIYLLLADVHKKQGEYQKAIENIKNYNKIDDKSLIAKHALISCEAAIKWKNNPTNHFLENEFSLNTINNDFSPTWGNNEQNKLLFVSSGISFSKKAKIDPSTGENLSALCTVKRPQNGDWGFVTKFMYNTFQNIGPSVLSHDFNTIFFTENSKTEYQKTISKIYCKEKFYNGWGNPEEIQFFPNNKNTSCKHPALDNKMNYIIFSSDFEGGYGGYDLWVSEFNKTTNKWMKPKNLGPEINTSFDELYPSLLDDTLYFSSNGHIGMGGLDIFKALPLSNIKWGKPENLKWPLNSPEDDYGIIFENSSDYAGYLSSSRQDLGGQGKSDIYRFWLPSNQFSLEVKVKNKENNLPISDVTVEIKGDDGSRFIKKTNESGTLLIVTDENNNRIIKKETSYEIRIEKNGFLIARNTITTKGKNQSLKFIEEVYLIPIMDDTYEATIEFPEIQFAKNSSDLLINKHVHSADSLDFLLTTLKDNPGIIIELQGHSDCTEKNAIELSQKRAETCVNYLVQRGIPSTRLIPVGYGNSFPRMEGLECVSIGKLSSKEEQEAAHQINRRIQFIVLDTDYADFVNSDDENNNLSEEEKLNDFKEFILDKRDAEIAQKDQEIAELQRINAEKDKENERLRKEQIQKDKLIEELRSQNRLEENQINYDDSNPFSKDEAIAISKKFYAIIIGIEDYDDENINDLNEPVKNANDLFELLTEKYTFNKNNSSLIINPTRDEIFKAFEDKKKILNEDDNLLIFYAGHGHWDPETEEGFWIPKDGRSGEDYTYISNADIKRKIKSIKSKNTLLIADACFSGGIFEGRSMSLSTAAKQLYRTKSRKVITSGILEKVPDKSVFMKYLLKYLENNNKKTLSSQELYTKFREAVINNSPNSQKPQFGEIRETGDEGGDFIFFRKN